MKNKFKIILSVFFTLFLSGFYSQNLVPNGSFEINTSCPVSVNTGTPDEVARATAWYRVRQTPDYFNSCSSSTIVSTPFNFCGNQLPASGNAYAGMWVYDSGTSNFREVIAAKLTTTLVVGQKYFAKLTVSNAEGYGFNCGIDKIGLRFSTVQHSIISPPPINNFAHLYFTTIMSDTINWKNIFGSFVADSNYKYIEVSNFFTDVNTNVQVLKTYPTNWSYYYIDDISLCTDSLEALNFNSTATLIKKSDQNTDNVIFFPNPCQGVVWSNINLLNEKVSIYDVLGNKITGFNLTQNTISLMNIPNGIYFISINNQSYQIFKKIIINN